MDAARKYLALILSLVLTVLPTYVAVFADGKATQQEDVGLVIATLSPFIIWVAPNLPDAKYVKPVSAWALVVAQTVAQVLPAGGFQALDMTQIVFIVSAAAAAAGITAFPNKTE